jgi:hypothetical protein
MDAMQENMQMFLVSHRVHRVPSEHMLVMGPRKNAKFAASEPTLPAMV